VSDAQSGAWHIAKKLKLDLICLKFSTLGSGSYILFNSIWQIIYTNNSLATFNLPQIQVFS